MNFLRCTGSRLQQQRGSAPNSPSAARPSPLRLHTSTAPPPTHENQAGEQTAAMAPTPHPKQKGPKARQPTARAIENLPGSLLGAPAATEDADEARGRTGTASDAVPERTGGRGKSNPKRKPTAAAGSVGLAETGEAAVQVAAAQSTAAEGASTAAGKKKSRKRKPAGSADAQLAEQDDVIRTVAASGATEDDGVSSAAVAASSPPAGQRAGGKRVRRDAPEAPVVASPTGAHCRGDYSSMHSTRA